MNGLLFATHILRSQLPRMSQNMRYLQYSGDDLQFNAISSKIMYYSFRDEKSRLQALHFPAHKLSSAGSFQFFRKNATFLKGNRCIIIKTFTPC